MANDMKLAHLGFAQPAIWREVAKVMHLDNSNHTNNDAH